MKRVCINRLRNEAKHLANTVAFLEQQEDLMQELFDILFRVCSSEASAPAPTEAFSNIAAHIARPEPRQKEADAQANQHSRSSSQQSANTQMANEGPDYSLNLYGDVRMSSHHPVYGLQAKQPAR